MRELQTGWFVFLIFFCWSHLSGSCENPTPSFCSISFVRKLVCRAKHTSPRFCLNKGGVTKIYDDQKKKEIMNLRKYDLLVPESCSRSLFSRHVLLNPCGKSLDGRKKGNLFRGAGLGVFFLAGGGSGRILSVSSSFFFSFFGQVFFFGNQEEEEEDWELLLLDDDVPSYHLILVFFLQCPPDVLLSGGSYPDQVLNR